MEWDVEYTDEFGLWWDTLSVDEQRAIDVAVEVLAEIGPGLGRPLVDTISGSRHTNMKELRPLIANIRILFAFDPRRTAILLIGGDKTNRWSDWYREMIPIADRLYDEHLEELRRNESIWHGKLVQEAPEPGTIRSGTQRTGRSDETSVIHGAPAG